MALQLKTPPVLESEDHYAEWKNDLEVWQLYTDLDIKKRGPAVYLTLSGRARECIRELQPAVLGSDAGVTLIINKLDTLFLKDKNTRAYLAFKAFYEYKRPSGVSITEFIVRFEYLYHKLQLFDMKLPEGVKAFFLLNAANVSEENERLARATVGDLTYSNMKEKIQKIFNDPVSGEGASGAPCVKSEPVFQTSSQRGSWRRRDAGRGRRGGFSGSFNKNGKYSSSSSGNPLGKDGKLLRCFNCDSTKHLSKFCAPLMALITVFILQRK